MYKKQRARKMRRAVIAVEISVLVLLLVGYCRPHIVRAIVRGQSATYTLPVLSSELPATSSECLPAWDVWTDADYLTLPVGAAWDSDGVLLYNYGWEYFRAGWQYSPRTVAAYGMTALQAWCQNGDQDGLRLALQQGNYLLKVAEHYGDSAVWLYDLPVSAYNAPPGWSSGLANGFVIALLTQLYEVTRNTEYLDTAAAAVRAFDLPMRVGGLRYVEDGSVWFEEYAHPDAIPSHVLNGHILALFGLDYYADHAGDPLAARLTDEGIATIRENIARFDGGNGMLYDLVLHNVLDVHHYHHAINIRGLYWMASETGDDYFRYWADRYSRMITAFG